VELDSIYHQPGWTPLPDNEFREQVSRAIEPDAWVVDGSYSTVQDIVWRRADTVVWYDLPYATVMARTIRRTLRRTFSREDLWNGNREPLSNLWSLKPEKSIIAWTATRHRVYRQRYSEASHDPRWAGLDFVRLRTHAEAGAFIDRVTAAGTKEE
jgi:adenylate kinase family enzyme